MWWCYAIVVGWHMALFAAYHVAQPLVWLPLTFGLAVPAVATAFKEIRSWSASTAYFGFVSSATTFFWIRSMQGEWPWLSFAVFAGQAAWLWTQRSELAGRSKPILWIAAFCAGVGFMSGGKGSPLWMIDLFKHTFSMSDAQAHEWVLTLRKVFHFTFYGTYALLWRSALARFDVKPRMLWACLVFVGALACFDEGRQHFTSDRTGSAWDILLDLSGAITFVGIASRRAKD